MRCSLFGVLLGAAIAGSVLAAPATAAVTPQATQDFLGKPSNLLTQYPNGGPEMIQAVQDFVASDRRALPALISLLAPGVANDAQSQALGTALGKIALSLLGPEPGTATQLQTSVVESRNVTAQQAFDAVVGGNIKLTAATTTGGGAEASINPGNAGGGVNGGSIDLHPFAGNSPDVFSNTFVGGPGGSGPGGGPSSPF